MAAHLTPYDAVPELGIRGLAPYPRNVKVVTLPRNIAPPVSGPAEYPVRRSPSRRRYPGRTSPKLSTPTPNR